MCFNNLLFLVYSIMPELSTYHLPRIYISAAHKSSGKTTLSIGLCAALQKQGLIVQPFKKGPDYIDPLWLSQASGRSCHNLDFNTMTDNEILRTLSEYGKSTDICIIEGNKGLYDGVALDGGDSNAAVAKLTQTPVILVIDTRGVTRGVAPLLMGYQLFDKKVNIAGVIFNLSSGGRHEAKLRAVTEEYTDIPVLGVVKKNPLLEVDERHLGLKPSNEGQGASTKIDEIATLIADSVDLSKVLEVSKSAVPLKARESKESITLNQATVRLGICEDSAFGFYYAGDKLALEKAGAELIPVNTLTDTQLPEDLDGLFIGGGFPETHMQQLSDNISMRTSIHKAIESGLPTYAECGGLMYLSQNIQWNGKSAPMVGIIPADAVMHQRPQGRGYVKLEETEHMLWPGNSQCEIVSAHEFHYSSLKGFESSGKFAYKVHRGVGITGDHDGWIYKNLLANYSHMRDTENFHWAQRFINFIRDSRHGN